MEKKQKFLIVRLSSFGDILQCLGVPQALKRRNPQTEVHWVVRADFSELLIPHRHIDQVWSFDRTGGLGGWWKFCRSLRRQEFTHVYDAHNNLRSWLLRLVFAFSGACFLRRPKFRWRRFLLFRWRKNLFPRPFRGQISFLRPLKKWNVPSDVPGESQLFFSPEVRSKVAAMFGDFRSFIAVAPSAAWPMKRWPLDHWKRLVQESDRRIVVLGGPADEFCQELFELAPERIINAAGKLSLLESCAALELAEVVISADTGLLHAADLLGKKTIALIGPTAFGYPSHANSVVMQSSLPCQPCSKDGRGRCRQPVYQKCMVDITPSQVLAAVDRLSEDR